MFCCQSSTVIETTELPSLSSKNKDLSSTTGTGDGGDVKKENEDGGGITVPIDVEELTLEEKYELAYGRIKDTPSLSVTPVPPMVVQQMNSTLLSSSTSRIATPLTAIVGTSSSTLPSSSIPSSGTASPVSYMHHTQREFTTTTNDLLSSISYEKFYSLSSSTTNHSSSTSSSLGEGFSPFLPSAFGGTLPSPHIKKGIVILHYRPGENDKSIHHHIPSSDKDVSGSSVLPSSTSSSSSSVVTPHHSHPHRQLGISIDDIEMEENSPSYDTFDRTDISVLSSFSRSVSPSHRNLNDNNNNKVFGNSTSSSMNIDDEIQQLEDQENEHILHPVGRIAFRDSNGRTIRIIGVNSTVPQAIRKTADIMRKHQHSLHQIHFPNIHRESSSDTTSTTAVTSSSSASSVLAQKATTSVISPRINTASVLASKPSVPKVTVPVFNETNGPNFTVPTISMSKKMEPVVEINGKLTTWTEDQSMIRLNDVKIFSRDPQPTTHTTVPKSVSKSSSSPIRELSDRKTTTTERSNTGSTVPKRSPSPVAKRTVTDIEQNDRTTPLNPEEERLYKHSLVQRVTTDYEQSLRTDSFSITKKKKNNNYVTKGEQAATSKKDHRSSSPSKGSPPSISTVQSMSKDRSITSSNSLQYEDIYPQQFTSPQHGSLVHQDSYYGNHSDSSNPDISFTFSSRSSSFEKITTKPVLLMTHSGKVSSFRTTSPSLVPSSSVSRTVPSPQGENHHSNVTMDEFFSHQNNRTSIEKPAELSKNTPTVPDTTTVPNVLSSGYVERTTVYSNPLIKPSGSSASTTVVSIPSSPPNSPSLGEHTSGTHYPSTDFHQKSSSLSSLNYGMGINSSNSSSNTYKGRLGSSPLRTAVSVRRVTLDNKISTLSSPAVSPNILPSSSRLESIPSPSSSSFRNNGNQPTTTTVDDETIDNHELSSVSFHIPTFDMIENNKNSSSSSRDIFTTNMVDDTKNKNNNNVTNPSPVITTRILTTTDGSSNHPYRSVTVRSQSLNNYRNDNKNNNSSNQENPNRTSSGYGEKGYTVPSLGPTILHPHGNKRILVPIILPSIGDHSTDESVVASSFSSLVHPQNEELNSQSSFIFQPLLPVTDRNDTPPLVYHRSNQGSSSSSSSSVSVSVNEPLHHPQTVYPIMEGSSSLSSTTASPLMHAENMNIYTSPGSKGMIASINTVSSSTMNDEIPLPTTSATTSLFVKD